MKIKSNTTKISYAGRVLVQPGGYFDGDAISDSFQTTASNVALVNSQYAHIEAYKNAHSSCNLSFLYDFQSVEDAFVFKLAAHEHALENPVGELSIEVGNTFRIYKAGLSQLDADISLAMNSVRLILRYSFLVGEIVN